MKQCFEIEEAISYAIRDYIPGRIKGRAFLPFVRGMHPSPLVPTGNNNMTRREFTDIYRHSLFLRNISVRKKEE